MASSHLPTPPLALPNTPSGLSSSTASIMSGPSGTSSRMSMGLKRIGEKMKLWSNRSVEASDVRYCMKQTLKAHHKFRRETQMLLQTLRGWAPQLPDPTTQTLIMEVTSALGPVWDAQRDHELKIVGDGVLQMLRKLQYDEEVWTMMARQAASSERAVHKAIYQGQSEDQIEAHMRHWELLRMQSDTEENRYSVANAQSVLQMIHRLLGLLDSSSQLLTESCNAAIKATNHYGDPDAPTSLSPLSPSLSLGGIHESAQFPGKKLEKIDKNTDSEFDKEFHEFDMWRPGV